MADITQHALAAISLEDFSHPGLRRMKFIFCDDQPNENSMGIQYEDFDAIMKSAIGTPVKVKFLGEGIGNHLGSVPIGHIVSMAEREEAGVHQLVADAILFADDYPEEISWLQDKFDKQEAPGISWELSYKEKESIIDKGITWLKGVVTRAATMVRDPAYGKRTAILALASNREISDEQLLRVFSQLNDDDSPKITTEGGSNRMEKELQDLRDELAALRTSTDTALAEKDTRITELETKISDLESAVSEKDTALAAYKTKEVLAQRTSELAAAGITLPEDPDKRAAKEAFYLSLSDEAFATVKEELAEAIASVKKEEPKKGLASLQQRSSLPKLTVDSVATETDALTERFKSYARTRDTQSE